jgi:hypothetical protein
MVRRSCEEDVMSGSRAENRASANGSGRRLVLTANPGTAAALGVGFEGTVPTASTTSEEGGRL